MLVDECDPELTLEAQDQLLMVNGKDVGEMTGTTWTILEGWIIYRTNTQQLVILLFEYSPPGILPHR